MTGRALPSLQRTQATWRYTALAIICPCLVPAAERADKLAFAVGQATQEQMRIDSDSRDVVSRSGVTGAWACLRWGHWTGSCSSAH
jgi:hypothetical protein